MACRPSVALLLSSLLAPSLLAVLPVLGLATGCGKGIPKYERRTADQWAEMLWSAEGETVMKASEVLVTFSDTHPAAVIDALERQLLRVPPTPEGVAFVITLDQVEAKRLGLQPRPAPDVLGMQLGHVRRRVEADKDQKGSIRGTADGRVEVILDGQRTREQAERVQRRLALRGALDLRVVADDPASAADPEAKAYDGPVPYATLLTTESSRYVEAARAGAPYHGEDRRWLVTPRAGPAPGELRAADFLLLEEPEPGAAVLDESWFSAARPERAADGSLGLALVVRPDRAAAYAAFVRAGAGRRLAVVVDGRVRGTLAVPVAPRDTLWVPIDRGSASPEAHAEALADLAIALSTGRLPWPMTPQPLPKEYGRDPPPGNPIAKTIAVIGSPAIPTLMRIANGTGPAWGKTSATWALEQIRLIEGQGTPPK